MCFATTGSRESCVLCFLNLQSKSYNLSEDIRKTTVGTTSLSADEPVSTSLMKDERGTVVLQHLLLWLMVALGHTAVRIGSSSFMVNAGTRKLGKTGLFHSVEYCIFPKFCLLSSFRNEIFLIAQILR